MRGTLFLSIVVSLFVANSGFAEVNAAPTPTDSESLCGVLNPAADPSLEAAKLTNIEADMPAIESQSPSGWCYDFTSNDLIDYQFHLKQIQSGVQSAYDAAHRISPIDSVFTDMKRQQKDVNPGATTDPVINLQEGGVPIYVFSSLQAAGKVRSLDQVPFTSSDEDTPETRAILKKLIDAYTAAHPDEAKEYVILGDILYQNGVYPEFQTFSLVNNNLATKAIANGQKTDLSQLENYTTLTADLPAPDFIVPSFDVHDVNITSSQRFLTLIKNSLAKKQPVSVAICANTLQPGTNTDTNCEGHAILLTGAGYVNGACNVRIRNTWGTGWSDKGYKTMPVGDFMSIAKQTGMLSADFLTSTTNAVGRQEIIKDDETFFGLIKTSDGGFNFQDGTLSYANGTAYKVTGGRLFRTK